jgi:hypothetical protein
MASHKDAMSQHTWICRIVDSYCVAVVSHPGQRCRVLVSLVQHEARLRHIQGISSLEAENTETSGGYVATLAASAGVSRLRAALRGFVATFNAVSQDRSAE